jgi:exopolysaccharide biosynthesis polyprenyl glycosylphosphotransferase
MTRSAGTPPRDARFAVAPAHRRERVRRPSGRAWPNVANAGPSGGPPWGSDADGRRSPSARVRERMCRVALLTADVLAAGLALAICIVLLGNTPDRLPLWAFVPVAVGCVALAKLLGLYDRDELTLRGSTLDETPALFQLATLFAFVVWIAGTPVLGGGLGRDQVLGLWGGAFLALLAFRGLARTAARRLSPADRCLVVGDPVAREHARRKIESAAHGVDATVPVATSIDELTDDDLAADALARLVERHDIHRLVIAPGASDQAEVLDLVRAAKALGLRVSLFPRMFEVVGSSVVFDDVEGVTLLGVRRFGLTRSSWVCKRAFDLVGTSVGLVLLAPFLALIAVAIRLDSPGPVFFRQRRVGRWGCVFQILKFRTMVEGADRRKAALRDRNEADGLFKITDDPRITRVGRFLRRTSLDELPQLWNVLRGEMSLVGPRPLVLEDDRQVEGWYRRRLDLAPGMTGRWQVLGSARIPLREMVKLGYLYAANWSLWSDVKILLRTLGFVVGRRGM